MKISVTTNKRWTQWEVDYLMRHYATHTCKEISEWVHHPPRSVQSKAFNLGLRKDKAFMAECAKRSQFTKGHRPFNKNRRWEEFMSEQSRCNSAKTQFKPGEVSPYSPTLRPVGYECVRTNKGRKYIWIKPEGRRMMPKHRWLWEKAHGAIPKGYNVQFKDGDTLNCVLDNLYLISRAKQLRKNYDDLPAERKTEIRRQIQDTRKKTIKRDQLRLRWGLEPLRGSLNESNMKVDA